MKKCSRCGNKGSRKFIYKLVNDKLKNLGWICYDCLMDDHKIKKGRK